MNTVIVIADDMTGANDTGAMLADIGFKASSSPTAHVSEMLLQAEALTINSDSRALPMAQAYDRVKSLTQAYGRNAQLLSKRIDTTLRGNVGAEIDAVLDGLGEPALACVVTAAPRAQRTCRKGKVYVAGIPLENTDISRDVRCPVNTSDVCEVIHRQSKRTTARIDIEDVRGELETALQSVTAEIVVFDAETDEDILRIATAVAALPRRVVAIDPGNFTKAYAGCILAKRKRSTLLMIGSRSEPSKKQLEYLTAQGLVHPVTPDIDKLLCGKEAEEYPDVLAKLQALCQTDELLCVTLVGTEISQQSRNAAQSLSDSFAKLGVAILDAMPQIDLCYASGGDVGQSLLTAMGVQGMRLISEALPLAVYGEVIGGRFHGFKMLTKGGMIGGEDAIQVMLAYARHNEIKER